MNFTSRLKKIAVALIILLACFPVSVIFTLLTSPLWLWFEQTFTIEAYGHSGPAEWCYLVSYGFIAALSTTIWALVRKRSNS